MSLSLTAIRYEMNRSSAAMSLRLCLRFFVLWMLVWAASDLFLVWYWTGRASGPGAHEYFSRWILAWFFTQKVPLYFLSLPYRGGRATIGSMYAYLNWRFYAGRSFGEWCAFYSLWSVLPASWTVGAIAYLLFHAPGNRGEGTQVRGIRLIRPRRWRVSCGAPLCRAIGLGSTWLGSTFRVQWNANIS
jgi:hypothetical protein